MAMRRLADDWVLPVIIHPLYYPIIAACCVRCVYQSVQAIPLADDDATRRSAPPVLFAEHARCDTQSHRLVYSTRYDWTTRLLVACLCVLCVLLTVFCVRGPYLPVPASLKYLTVVAATPPSAAGKRYLTPIRVGFTKKRNILTRGYGKDTHRYMYVRITHAS